MTRFGTAGRLSAWTGIAPGNGETAGKQRWGMTRKGNRALRTDLMQLAHAAARQLHQRLAAHRGKKRAVMTVAHAIVVGAFHTLSHHEPYHELGATYVAEHRHE
jgi:transposase